MVRLAWLTCALGAVAACQERPGNNDWPGDVREAFEKAAEFDLYSLDPSDGGREAVGFHGWKILGKTLVKEEVAKKVRDAVDKGRRESDGTVAKCFEPRHGIRIVREKKTYDLVICYACLSAEVYEGEEMRSRFLTTPAPAEVLNKVLADAKVPLPKR